MAARARPEFANPPGPPCTPVVRNTTVPVGWEPATARHTLVLPIPADPATTAAAASPQPADSASWQAASSAIRPNSATRPA